MALTGALIVTTIITTAIFIFINALLLMLVTKIFKVQDQSYKSALWVAAIAGAVGLVFNWVIAAIPSSGVAVSSIINFLLIGVLLTLYLIKLKYKLAWGKAALVWLVYFLFALVVGFVIGFVIGLMVVSMGLGTALSAAAI